MAAADWVADIPWVQRAVNAFSATGEMGLADVNYRPRAGQQRMVRWSLRRAPARGRPLPIWFPLC